MFYTHVNFIYKKNVLQLSNISCHIFYGQYACTLQLTDHHTYEETTTKLRTGKWPDTVASLLRSFVKLRNWKKTKWK